MAGSEHDDQRDRDRDGGDSAPDWTTWLRSRLERVASSERKGAEAPANEEGRDEPLSTGGPGEPALPRFQDDDTGELGLRLDWPDHPLQPGRGAGSEAGPEVVRFRPEPAPPEPVRLGPDPASFHPAPSEEVQADDLPGPDLAPTVPATGGPPEQPEQAEAAEQPEVPEQVVEQPEVPEQVAEPEVAAAEPRPALRPDPDLESLKTAVVALSARVDLLVDTTASVRTVLGERLDDYAEVVSRTARSAASDLEEYRRMHVASVTELRREAGETAETLRRLTGLLEEMPPGDPLREEALAPVPERLDRLEEAVGRVGDELALLRDHADAAAAAGEPWTDAVRQLFEEVVAGRQEEDGHDPLADVPERLGRLEGAMGQLVAELGNLRNDLEAEPPPPPEPALQPGQVEAIARAVADLLQSRAQPPAPRPSGARRAAAAPPAPRPRRTTQIRANPPPERGRR